MPGLAQTADRLDPEWFFDPLALDRSAIPKLLPLAWTAHQELLD